MSDILRGCRNCVYSERHGKEFGYYLLCLLTGEDVSGKKPCGKYEPNDDVLLKENAELSKKIGQFEQYAELGRLILNGNPCYFGYEYADGDCESVVCSDNEKKVCKKRAELLAEGGEWDG